MVLGVRRVGVDLRRGVEIKAGAGGERFDIVRVHITGAAVMRSFAAIGAVFDDAEHAAGL